MFLFDSWIAKCPLLYHLFGCFDSSFKQNIYCHSAFIIRDINKLSTKLLKRPIKIWGAPSLLLQYADLFYYIHPAHFSVKSDKNKTRRAPIYKQLTSNRTLFGFQVFV